MGTEHPVPGQASQGLGGQVGVEAVREDGEGGTKREEPSVTMRSWDLGLGK